MLHAWEKRAYRVLVEKRPLGRPRSGDIKMDIREIGSGDGLWTGFI
jgi:hypothetical protein